MVLNPRPIEMRTAADVGRRLDAWAERDLVGGEGWAAALVASRWWLDYSTRNQLLLASYGAQGRVAGVETWRLVPSAGGRTCAVAAGEFGLPIRVPVTEPGVQPDPFVGGARRTASVVERWEWRPVFCEAQLARRPDPEVAPQPQVPAVLAVEGHGADAFGVVARKVTARVVRGRVPKRLVDPVELLAYAAARHKPGGGRPPLDETRARQVALLVAGRVGHGRSELPGFDPSGLAPRQRWEQLGDVLEPARRLIAAVGHELGVDLCTSGLPRMEIGDDRVVPAGRRNRLPKATVEALPVGEWVEVGPYTQVEWQARGEEHGSGKAAYLRVNKSSYLVAIEQGDVAAWRIEDMRSPIGAGLWASGPAANLSDAKQIATATLEARYPHRTRTPTRDTRTPSPAERPDPPPAGWEPVHERPGAIERQLTDGVGVFVIPRGDRWMPFVSAPVVGHGTILDDTDSRDEAIDAVLLAGKRMTRALAGERVGFDQALDALARGPRYHRDDLVRLAGTRLDTSQRERLADDDVTPRELVELLQIAGATPATTVAVLAAEHIDATETAGLLPVVGIPNSTGIGALVELWGLDRVAAAELLGADAVEMRAAGCTAVEIMAARPGQVLEHLPTEPGLWDLAAGTMRVAGHTDTDVADHLSRHAPDGDCFAAGIAAAVDDPTAAIVLALDRGVGAEVLASISERYGLSPSATAAALDDANTPTPVAVATLLARCDGDPVLTTQLARSALHVRTGTVTDALTAADITADATELRAARPLSADREAWLRTHLPHQPARPTPVDGPGALLAALPAPTPPAAGAEHLIPEPDPASPTVPGPIALPEPMEVNP